MGASTLSGSGGQRGGGAWRGSSGPDEWLELLSVLVPDPVLASEYGLTPREADVARRMAVGASNKEIAGDLQVSPNTVRKHAERVRQKVGVPSRSMLSFALLSVGWRRIE